MPQAARVLLLLQLLLPATMPTTAIDQLWDYNDPAGTEQKFRALLATAEASGDAEFQAELLTQIARTFGLRQQFDDAHATLDRADKLIQPNMTRVRVRYLLERGRAYNSADDRDRALPLFMQAFELGSANKLEALAIDAAHMIAIAVPSPEEQLRWNQRAVELAKASGDPAARRWLASLYNNIGCIYDDQKQYEQAMSAFQQALALREAMGQKSQTRIARYTIARTLRRLNRIDEALALAESIHRDAVADNQIDPYVCEEIGEDLLLKDRSSEAAGYFKIAFDQLSKDAWLVRHEPQRLARMDRLARPK
jgi:tetratricopeptide (TPR) repeat protein